MADRRIDLDHPPWRPSLKIRCNAELGPAEIDTHCAPDREGKALLSARGYFRALRVARTIADLDGSGRTLGDRLAEAPWYRGLEGRPV